MLTARVTLALACAGAVLSLACGGSGSTTSPSPAPASASVTESFSASVGVGGSVFYSFSMAQYGNVAVTLTGLTGTDMPDGLTLGVGIGTPSGTSCSVTSSANASAGDTAQVTGVYGPGVFCVRVYDTGLLVAPVSFTATVAHS